MLVNYFSGDWESEYLVFFSLIRWRNPKRLMEIQMLIGQKE